MSEISFLKMSFPLDQIESQFSEIAFSHPGSVTERGEKDAYMMFLDLLYDIQGNKIVFTIIICMFHFFVVGIDTL